MENGPIPASVANNMIEEYLLYMKSQGINMDKQTHSVSFTRDKLMDWLSRSMADADHHGQPAAWGNPTPDDGFHGRW